MQRTLLVLMLLVAAAIAGLGLVGWQNSRVKKDLEAILERGIEVGSVEMQWKSGGQTVTFKSTRTATETEAQWAARARAEYDALRVVFPPDN